MAKFKSRPYPAPKSAETVNRAVSSADLAAAAATVMSEYNRILRVTRSAAEAAEAQRQSEIFKHLIEWIWGWRGTRAAEKQLELWD